jgi:hypothetical protein
MNEPVTEADYWRGGILQFYMEQMHPDRILEAAALSKTGEQFDAAISASIRLSEIAEAAADEAYLSRHFR